MKTALILLLSVAWPLLSGLGADATLWYRQPASPNKLLQEALPLGNGPGVRAGGTIGNIRIHIYRRKPSP